MSNHFPQMNLGGDFTRREVLKLTGATIATTWTGAPSRAAVLFQPPAATKLPTRAIVIGINEYAHRQTTKLNTPVPSALGFTKWLIEHAGVNKNNITLLTSPLQNAFMGVECKLADVASIEDTIQSVAGATGPQSERLYFFFSGHGVSFSSERLRLAYSTRNLFPEGDGLVPCDYKPAKPISLTSIQQRFENTSYLEQFYILDACRTLNSSALHLIDPNLDLATEPRTTQPYIICSTQPDQLALDNPFFIKKLLGALEKGEGACLNFDKQTGRYLIRWSGLKSYLERCFTKDCQNTAAPGLPPKCTHPYIFGPTIYIPESPCLIDFTPTDVKRSFTITVRPPAFAQGAKYTIRHDPERTVIEKGDVPTSGIINVELPPRRYVVVVTPKGEEGLPASFNPDEDEPIVFDFSEPIPNPAPPPDPPVARVEYAAQGGGNSELVIAAYDPNARLELFDTAGKLVLQANNQPCIALGSMKVTGLKPDVYRAVMKTSLATTAGSLTVNQPRFVPVAKDDSAVIEFGPPLPANSNGFAAGPIPEEQPPIPGSQALILYDGFQQSLTDLLLRTLRAADGDVNVAALVTKSLGLGPFEGPQGVRIVFGIGLDGRDPTLASLKTTLLAGSLDENDLKPLTAKECHIEGVTTFADPRPPGCFRLRIERLLGDKIDKADFACMVLPGRICDLIIDESVSGAIRISQFSPETRPGQALDPVFVTKLHLMERDLHDGPTERAPQLLQELQRFPIVEPICLAMAVHITSQSPDQRDLPAIAAKLVEVAPLLPDGHIARGYVAEMARQPDAAAVHYKAALDRGLPLLNPLLKLLVYGALRLRLEHPKLEFVRKVWKNIIPGPLWTAWRPQSQ